VYDAIHRVSTGGVCFASKDSYIPINNLHSVVACRGMAEPRWEGRR